MRDAKRFAWIGSGLAVALLIVYMVASEWLSAHPVVYVAMSAFSVLFSSLSMWHSLRGRLGARVHDRD